MATIERFDIDNPRFPQATTEVPWDHLLPAGIPLVAPEHLCASSLPYDIISLPPASAFSDTVVIGFPGPLVPDAPFTPEEPIGCEMELANDSDVLSEEEASPITPATRSKICSLDLPEIAVPTEQVATPTEQVATPTEQVDAEDLSRYGARKTLESAAAARKARRATTALITLLALSLAVIVALLAISSILISGATGQGKQIAEDDQEAFSESLSLPISDFEFIPQTYEQAMEISPDSSPLTIADIDAIPAGKEITVFGASRVVTDIRSGATVEIAPSLSVEVRSAIQKAIDAISPYDVGFVFADIESGRGIAYNVDEQIYGASTFKAILATYILEKVAADPTRGISKSTRRLIEASVLWSDNDSFLSLSNAYVGSGFYEWLGEIGVDRSIVSRGSFATYTARDSAKMWLHIYSYLQSGAEEALWLRELLGDTNMSFIRDELGSYAIEYASDAGAGADASGSGARGSSGSSSDGASAGDGNGRANSNSNTCNDATSNANSNTSGVDLVMEYEAEDGSQVLVEVASALPASDAAGAVVMNKAGWIAAGGRYNSTSDNAVIECGGRHYLMCIMTDQPYSDAAARKVSRLAAAVFAARGCLVLM